MKFVKVVVDGRVEMRAENYDELISRPKIEVPENPDASPTEEEIEAYKRNLYRLNRSLEYPPITDYIDGVVKGDQAQVDAYIAACQEVKLKYPKPTQE